MVCRYKGDDLINIIKVDRPSNTVNITITKCIVQVGDLAFTENNPVFPYYISITKAQSKLLDFSNEVYVAIVYNDEAGHTNIKRTCMGYFTLNLNSQVVQDE